jgi:hypothetical protein
LVCVTLMLIIRTMKQRFCHNFKNFPTFMFFTRNIV